MSIFSLYVAFKQSSEQLIVKAFIEAVEKDETEIHLLQCPYIAI